MKPNLEYLKIRDFNDIIKTNGHIIDESIMSLFRSELHRPLSRDLRVSAASKELTGGWTSSHVIITNINLKQHLFPFEREEILKAFNKANWLNWDDAENYLERISKVFTCNYDKIIEKCDKKDRSEYEKGKEYCRKNKTEIEKKYSNEYIAIYNNEVVDSDADFSNLASRVYSKYGYRPIYMPYISSRTRILRIVTPKFERIG